MRKHLLTTLAVMLVCLGAWAQGVTTGSFIGFVKDSKGGPLPGANVVAVHTPTGSQYGTATRADGRFTIANVRVGGPYKITVSFVGYENQDKDNLFVELGNATNVDFALAETGTQLSEVSVTAAKDPVMNSERTGAATNISNQVITRLPTISRSFNDYVRMTPQANGNGFAGRSDGYNNITVDGALFNNAFGLSGTVGGQTNAQPISLDAVDQITTSVAPYDVTQGSFTGAGVNVVTRSGTNNVEGSVYYFTKNQNFVGSKIGDASNTYSNFTFNNMGFRLGAPIIKNKLFVFANYERERQTVPGTTFSASNGSNSGSTVSQAKTSTLDSLSNFLLSNYGYNAGPYQGYDLQQNSDKATLKFDWNISSNHKFTIKYNYLKSYRDVSPSNSGLSLAGSRSPNQYGLPFLGAYYRINNNLNSVIAELNSTFGTKFSNKFQIGFTAFRDFRGTPNSAGVFPLVDIGNGVGTTPQNLTSFGYEPFSANNILNTNVFQLSDNFDIYKNKHTITVGTYNEFYHFENGFDPNYFGNYSFNSVSDFYKSAAGNPGYIRSYSLGYSTAPDGSFPLVSVDAYQLGLYAQDKYEVNERLNVTVGIRGDMPVINTNVAENTQAAGFQFADGQTIHTSQVQKSSLLWSPRIGFNWDVFGDRSTQIRGGSGIFTGRVPYVWISNQASNNGLLFNQVAYNALTIPSNYVFSPDVDAYRPGKNGNPPASTSPTYNLAVTDQNFKFPQVWRTNIAIDQKLPGGIIGSLDIAFTQDINAVYHRNVNLPTPAFNANGADNRPIYYKTFPVVPNSKGIVINSSNNTRINPNISDAILMSNTNKGYSYFITAQFKKNFGFGLDAMVAYTYTDARSVNDGGSIAQSIWRDRYISGNPNDNVLSYSNYLLTNRIIASLNYRKEYAGHFATSVGAFYSLAQSGRFSYSYAGDMNGDNSNGTNDLIYVPRNQSEILLIDDGPNHTAAQQWAELDQYINQDSYLSSRRGQYAERNGGIQPWRGQLDIRILQDFYVEVGKEKKHRNTVQVSLDIFNFGNMLNSNWGLYQIPNRQNLLTFQGYDANKTPEFIFPYLNASTKTPLTSTFRNDLGLLSRWQMQVGVRYIFN